MRHIARSRSVRNDQKGIVLVVALIVLVAMTLAAVALMRSVDISTQIAGNLAYRQSGVQAADGAAEIARDWLLKQATQDITSLDANISPSYFASTGASDTFDPLTFDWTGKSKVPKNAAGNEAQYVIHRMCEAPGDPASEGTNCFTSPVVVSGDSQGIKPDIPPSTVSNNPYYRVTVRVTGLKNTVTYTQVMVY